MESRETLPLIVTLICGPIQLLILFHLIKNTRSNINKTIAIAYASIISFLLYPIGVCIQSIYAISISSSNKQFSHTICVYRTFTQTSFTVGKILMYLFYTSRLYEVFKGSSFQYKKLPLQLFALFIIIGFFTTISLFAIPVFGGFAKTSHSEIHSTRDCDAKFRSNSSLNSTDMATAGITINMVTDIVVAIVMLRLYLKKLILLSVAFDNFEFKSKKHRDKNEVFMKLILKTTNLLILCVVTEYVIVLVSVLQIGQYWMAINHTVNVFCIYFSFGTFNDKLYQKICCCTDNKYCYQCCAALCFCCCLPKNTDEIIAVAIMEHSKSATNNNEPDPSVTTNATNTDNTHNKIKSHSTIAIELNVESTNEK